MESHWLTTPGKQAAATDEASASDILALAQQLQAHGEQLVTEAQVIEMGRELGIRPEYVREALRLRGRAMPLEPPRVEERLPQDQEQGTHLIAGVARSLALIFAVGMLPVAWSALERAGLPGVPPFAMLAAMVAGWSAQYPRLARVSGAMAVPVVLLCAVFYDRLPGMYRGFGPDTALLSMLSLCPLCASAASSSAGARRWLERQVQRPRLGAHGR